MRQTLHSLMLVIVFAVSTPLLVWSLRFHDASGIAFRNPRPELNGPFYIVALLCAIAPIIAVVFIVSLLAYSGQVNWRKTIASSVCTLALCALGFATAAIFRRTDDTLWPVFTAMIGAGIGVVAAADTYMKLKAGGWR